MPDRPIPSLRLATLLPVWVGGVLLSVAACLLLALPLPGVLIWLVIGAGQWLALAVALLLLRPPATVAPAPPAPLAAAKPDQAESLRRLRHDVRGALSPALLTADRLLTHADPAVQRAGDIMVRAVERAAALLNESAPPNG